MKTKRSKTTAVAALCLAGLCVVGAATAAAADPGSQGDPIVTLSYLNQTVTPSLMNKVDKAVSANEKALVDKLNAAIDSYTKQMDAALQNGGTGSAAYSVVSLSSGQTMKLEVGCEVMLRAGSASCVSSSSPGLIDTTGGTTLDGGKALVKNHLYMATISDRSIKANGAVKVLVRGGYSIR